MISSDDPRITAYADGALPADEAERFERELAASPEVRAEIARLRELQRLLREAFAEETAEDEVLHIEEAEPAVRTIAQKRPYSIYRDADDHRAEAAGWRPLTPIGGAGGRTRWLAWLFPGWLAPVAGAACVLLLLAAIILPTTGKVRESTRRSTASSHLRQIGQAALIYAGENHGKLPEAKSVWDFARKLAQGGGLDEAALWRLPVDPASGASPAVATVLTPDRRALDPAFARSLPAFAVVLGEVDVSKAPPTTPIAWTRGLQPDGTWASHSPYGKEGGHIVFLGGNVAFYRNVHDLLARYDGKGMTSDILEALPPGSRIGEYVPTEAEQVSWAKAYRPSPDDSIWIKARHSKAFLAGLTALCGVGGVALVVYLSRRRPA